MKYLLMFLAWLKKLVEKGKLNPQDFAETLDIVNQSGVTPLGNPIKRRYRPGCYKKEAGRFLNQKQKRKRYRQSHYSY